VHAIGDGAAEQVLGALPVGARFVTQPGTPLGSPLGFQQRAHAYPQPDTPYEADERQTQCLDLGKQPFPELRLAFERPRACSENRLHLSTPCPPRVVQECPGLASIVFYVPADAVSTPVALLRVQQIHQPRPETEAAK
jgi:hypothetical protein